MNIDLLWREAFLRSLTGTAAHIGDGIEGHDDVDRIVSAATLIASAACEVLHDQHVMTGSRAALDAKPDTMPTDEYHGARQ